MLLDSVALVINFAVLITWLWSINLLLVQAITGIYLLVQYY